MAIAGDVTPAAGAADADVVTPADGVAPEADKLEADAAAGDDKSVDATDDKTPEEGDKVEDGKADDTSDLLGAPETYEDFTVPEGMQLDKERLEKFLPIISEMGLSQKGAQQLIDLQAEVAQAAHDAQAAAWEETQTGWTEASKADKEIGGVDFDANLAVAHTFLEKFGTPALVTALEATGLGNHPELIRLFFRGGKELENDTMSRGGASAPVSSLAERMFPKHVKSE